MPADCMSASTRISGRSSSQYEIPQLFALELLFDDPREHEGDLRVFRRVLGGFRDVDLGHRDLLRARADQVADRNHAMPEKFLGQLVQAVSAGTGVEQIVADHRVEADFAQLDAEPPQHQHFVLDVLIDDHDGRILEVRPQSVDHALRIERALSGRSTNGQVVSESLLPTKGPADDLGD